jgi:hypothetical protein
MTNYSVFFDRAWQIEAVLAAVKDSFAVDPVDSSTTRYAGKRFEWAAMGVRYVITDTLEYEDDMGIPLSTYGIEIGLNRLDLIAEFDGYELMLDAAARMIAWKLARVLATKTTVVRNLDRIVATHES